MSLHGEKRHSSGTPDFWKGIEVDKAKIEIIKELPPLTSVKGVRSFLAMSTSTEDLSETSPKCRSLCLLFLCREFPLILITPI